MQETRLAGCSNIRKCKRSADWSWHSWDGQRRRAMSWCGMTCESRSTRSTAAAYRTPRSRRYRGNRNHYLPTEYRLELTRDPLLDLRYRRFAAGHFLERCHAVLRDTARNDQAEMSQVGVHVEREAVA